MKDLLQSLIALSEGETKDTKTGRVHKGTYGSEYETDKDGNEKKKEATAAKKGRGRPKKDADSSGEVKTYDTKSLGSVFGGGQKPKKEIGKVSKKHSLKEYMESVEDTKHAEAVMEGMFGNTVDHSSVAANLGKLAKVIKSVQTPEQFAVAQKYARRMSGTIMKHQHDNMGFGSGLKSNLQVMRAISADLKAKAEELGVPYDPLAEDGEQVTIAPAQSNTQVIKQGDKTLGTVTNPSLAATIKSAIGKGQMSLAGSELDEQTFTVPGSGTTCAGGCDGDDSSSVWHPPSGTYTKQPAPTATTEGKDEGKPGKNFAKIAKSAGEKYGSKAAGERVAGAVRNKLKAQGKLEEAKPDFLDVDKDGDKKESFKKAVKDKKKVAEGRDLESSEYLDEKVAKILAREKPGMDTVKSNDAFYAAIYNELIACGLTPKAARYKVSYDEDFISDVASAYAHYQKNPTLDEGSLDDFRQHGPEIEPVFNRTSSSMAEPKGTPVTAKRPVQNPTDWSVDPINAATDRAFNFVSSLGKKSPFKEGTDMKDIQLESWSKQLNGLLSEGITVSSSQGQQGSPDSVSVTATDNDAQSLMSVLRNAGIGGFGAEPQSPEIGYGVAQGGEEEATGTGTEPQPSPDVVGNDGDMLSMLKKMAGLSGGDAEVVTIDATGDEGGQDYEDEEGSDETALQPADGEEEEGSEESSEEESDDEEDEVEEGNKFTGNLAKARAAGKEEADLDGDGDMEKVHEGEHTCNECGMMESSCECESEQVEEAYANEADQELASLKALLSMGNDLHNVKRNQTVGNPTQVSVQEAIRDWKKLSGI